MTLHWLEQQLADHGLFVMGTCAADAPDHGKTRVLIGADRDFWQHFSESPEARDGAADPVDRWSKRVIGDVARALNATTDYPSDGPPYPPFIGWALKSGRFHQSPVGMMIHDKAGLMISLRGALTLALEHGAPFRAAPSPCGSCRDQPCRTACPVEALSENDGYNVAACHAYLDKPEGRSCMAFGCAARRACPVSATFDRPAAQSAFHMKAFHPS